MSQPIPPECRACQYDPISNRAQITEAANSGDYITNNLNQYTGQAVPGDGTRTFDYDVDGNFTSLVENSSETVYIWSMENRLITVQSASPIDSDKKVVFIYDYMGRRVKKRFTLGLSATGR
ncbi:MAG: hypothetical protein WA081_08730 [Desulfosalsimonadaceae bacterium]